MDLVHKIIKYVDNWYENTEDDVYEMQTWFDLIRDIINEFNLDAQSTYTTSKGMVLYIGRESYRILSKAMTNCVEPTTLEYLYSHNVVVD